MELKDRVVVITGSGRGLGRAFARRLLEDGARVCLSDIQETAGLATKEDLQGQFGQDRVHFVRCDVTQIKEMEALYDQAEDYFQDKVDIWCNNAGVNHKAGWRNCMDIDIISVMAGTYLALDRMSKANGGRGGLIVNTASIAGILYGSEPSLVTWKRDAELAEANPYFVAKHGVVTLTRALSNPEVERETGVRLMCICPSFADTDIIREGMEDRTATVREKIQAEFGLMSPEYVAGGFHALITTCGNGAALVVIKDVPYFTFPDVNLPIILALAMAAKVFGARVFQWHHQIVFFSLLLLILQLILRFLMSFLF